MCKETNNELVCVKQKAVRGLYFRSGHITFIPNSFPVHILMPRHITITCATGIPMSNITITIIITTIHITTITKLTTDTIETPLPVIQVIHNAKEIFASFADDA